MSKTTIERKVSSYPSPRDRRLVEAQALAENTSISKIVAEVLRKHYDSLTEVERQSIIHRSKFTP